MSLEFRPVKEGRQIAEWVKPLKGKSGVYVIRERVPPIAAFFELAEILYIGESHTGRLYATLLRHFQHWTGKTAGPTFAVSKVEVAVARCPANRALNLQNAMIEEFRPKLNITANPDAEGKPW
jgi:excinuclease UvrABC nuclease subunit